MTDSETGHLRGTPHEMVLTPTGYSLAIDRTSLGSKEAL
jgi:hypothetical protein